MTRRWTLAIAGIVAGVFAACGASEGSGPLEGDEGDGDADNTPDAGDTAPAFPFPDPDWTVGDPLAHGLDPAALEEAAAAAERTHSKCLLVVRHGELVFERYFHGADVHTQSNSWSIGKSYASTLVGIAIDRGDLASLDEPVASYIGAWADDERASITVRDIVSMSSGLRWSAFQDYGQMVMLASDHSAFALDLGVESAPGTDWVYHNGGVQVLEPLFRSATGLSIEEYAERHLWSRIGSNGSWGRDRSGNPTAYANALASCRDHARFGYLYLRRGAWSDGRVVSPDWVDAALAPSQADNRAYGFLFWLNGFEPAKSAMMEERDGVLAPYAPDDLFGARGFGNQFIDVIPSLDLVVVRIGADPLTAATSLDINALIADARFDAHEEIMAPLLDAVLD